MRTYCKAVTDPGIILAGSQTEGRQKRS